MKCAREILETKKISDMEREERKRQEELAKEQARAKRREEAKAATFKYAEELVSQLYSRAKNGGDLKITHYYESNPDVLYRPMVKDSYKYSNGVQAWYSSSAVPPLNLEYLIELLTSLCYQVERDTVLLHVNSCRSEKFTRIIISVPATLPCD
jgi:hypothetical protein